MKIDFCNSIHNIEEYDWLTDAIVGYVAINHSLKNANVYECFVPFYQ